MPYSPSTVELLEALDEFSSRRLSRRDDLGLLLELAKKGRKIRELDELAFNAKFAYRTYGIMQRIGKDGQGYELLRREFGGAIERSGDLARTILATAPPAERDRFQERYLHLTPDALQDFLALCYDLSWYKNWHIDRRGTPLRPSTPD